LVQGLLPLAMLVFFNRKIYLDVRERERRRRPRRPPHPHPTLVTDRNNGRGAGEASVRLHVV